jgi:hypothetical protein
MPKDKRKRNQRQVRAGAALVTIANVPIVSTGTYHLASGITTFTEEHLRAAVAAQDDPAVTAPRLKIGHESDFGDGEPCFGKVLNMYLGDNDQTIYGDYVGVPVWLAELMPTAYPARSIEGAFDAVVAEDKAPHALLITAVSLLGVVAPGVSTLEDLPDLYGEKAPDGLEIIATTNLVAGSKIIAKAVGGDMPKEKITAAVSVDDVRREYYGSLDSSQAWWWICRVEVDPMQLIVDDEEGSLYRVPYDPTGSEITFDDPVEVEIVYVDVGSDKAKAAKAAAGDGGRVVASYNNRSESRPDDDEEGGSVPKPKAKSKKDRAKALRASLGLAEDATDKEVAAALKEAEELLASDGDDDDEPDDEPDDDDTPDDDEENDDDETDDDDEPSDDEPSDDDDEPVEAGTVTMDAAGAAKLKSDAAKGRKAYAKQQKDEREALLSAAVKAGKFPRARKDHWRKLYKKDPEGTKAAIEDLDSNVVPVDERGTGEHDDVDAGNGSSYPESWLSPAELARIAAAKGGNGSGSITTQEVS